MDGLTLDAESVRREVREGDYTQAQLTIIENTPAEVINETIQNLVDDHFWGAYDRLRSEVIEAILAQTAKAAPVLWYLSVDDGNETVITLHRSEQAALDCLRENYADYYESGLVRDEDLVEFVTSQGCVVRLGSQEIPQ